MNTSNPTSQLKWGQSHEHRRALDWLNERTDESVYFFGVELDLVKIGTSPPAPDFRLLAQPNDWQKAVKSQTGVSDTALARHNFFVQVVETIGTLRPAFRPPKVGYENWTSMSAGPFGNYSISFPARDRLRAEVYFDTGRKETTKRLFDDVAADKAAIEQAIGTDLSWERLDEKRASRIAAYRSAPNLTDEEDSSIARDWVVKTILKFMELLDDRLRQEARRLRSASETGRQ